MANAPERIKENASRAAAILADIKETVRVGQDTEEYLYENLKCAVCFRLMIDAGTADTDDLRKLCILSIRRQMPEHEGVSDREIVRQIEKYDCHQANLVAQKKVLLMLYIESALGIHLADDEATEVLTVKDLADKAGKALRQKYAEGLPGD